MAGVSWWSVQSRSMRRRGRRWSSRRASREGPGDVQAGVPEKPWRAGSTQGGRTALTRVVYAASCQRLQGFDARLRAVEAVTRSGSACTPSRPRLESLCHGQRPLHHVLGRERSVTPIAFFTILTVNISMYRARLHFSARTGRTTGSISLAAAAATRLLLEEVARGGPEASVMDWSDRAAC